MHDGVKGGTTTEKEGERGDKGRGKYSRSVLRHSERIYEYRELTASKIPVEYEIHFSDPST